MPEPVARRPFQEFDLSNGFRPQPNTFLHLFGRQLVAPTCFVGIRQVSEGHGRGNKMTDFLEDLSPRRRNEAVADTGDVHQILALVISDDERVKSVWPRNVSTDDQLLSAIRPAFDPCTGSFSCLVRAIFAFSDGSFQLLLPHGGKQVVRGNLELFGDADSRRTQPQKRFHQPTALTERQTCEVSVVTDKKIEDKIVDTRRFAAEALEQIEAWSARFI